MKYNTLSKVNFIQKIEMPISCQVRTNDLRSKGSTVQAKIAANDHFLIFKNLISNKKYKDQSHSFIICYTTNMSTFQEHFIRLQEIYTLLTDGQIDIDQAMTLQQEAQTHISACQTILHDYDTQFSQTDNVSSAT